MDIILCKSVTLMCSASCSKKLYMEKPSFWMHIWIHDSKMFFFKAFLFFILAISIFLFVSISYINYYLVILRLDWNDQDWYVRKSSIEYWIYWNFNISDIQFLFSFLNVVLCFLGDDTFGYISDIYGFINWSLRSAAGLRTRTLENKAEIVSEVEKNVWPPIMAGKVKPVIYKSFPLSQAAEAHQLMESSNHIGKILLVPWIKPIL